jgi:RimJ/RimL family protein N-acetyltransferase
MDKGFMKTTELHTNNPDIHLIEPDVERDAALGVQWFEGKLGRNTLSLMGVSDADNKPTSLEQEKERVKDFIENDSQLNWMISYEDKVVGSIWVDLKPSEYLQSPSVHIMIGNPEARGKGIGLSTTAAVVEHLQKQGYTQVYSRYITNNEGSKNLLAKLGFHELGTPYTDEDNLEFQNVVKEKEVMKETEPIPPYTISPMVLDDTEGMYNLLRSGHRDTYVNEALGITAEKVDQRFTKSTAEERRARNEQRIDDPNNQVWVAKDEQQNVIGMVAPRIEEDGTRRLGALYVVKDWQGKGIAHELMAKAIDWLDGEHNDIKLGVVTYNERAKAFYRKYGFEEVPNSETLFDELIPEVFMLRKAQK